MLTVTCPSCKTPNRANAKFCSRCGYTLNPPMPAIPGSWQAWLAQVRQTFTLAWTQSTAELRALYGEWIARTPALTGSVVAAPHPIQVSIIVQGLFGQIPNPTGQNQQAGLLLQIQDTRYIHPVDAVLIGARTGTPPQAGDLVSAWGQWDNGLKGYRVWRMQITQRSGQPANLDLTTGRPFPLALLSLVLLAFVLLLCVCSLFGRIF